MKQLTNGNGKICYDLQNIGGRGRETEKYWRFDLMSVKFNWRKSK